MDRARVDPVWERSRSGAAQQYIRSASLGISQGTLT